MEITNLTMHSFSKGDGQGTSPNASGSKVTLQGGLLIGSQTYPVTMTLAVNQVNGMDEFNSSGSFSAEITEED
jgi:hypothetical protein